MSDRRMVALLGAGLGALLLAGCGGDGGAKGEAGAADSASPSASSSGSASASDAPSGSSEERSQLGPDTAVGTAQEFGERDRCVNASDYAYLSGALAGDTGKDPELVTRVVERMDQINSAMVGQVPEDQTVDALATRRTLGVLKNAIESDPDLDLDSLPKAVVRQILPLQGRVASFAQAQRADCEGEVEGFGTGLRPPV